MEPSEPRIEIFAPFGEAFETTTKILFRPFDLAKWFVIGFAAWLATMFGGLNFNFRSGYNKKDWNWKAQSDGFPFSFADAPPWLLPVIIGGGIVVLAIVLLLLWLNSRGRFMFTDCIVRNRGAIVAPWHEFRPEGNRYFLLQLIISVCSTLLAGGLVILFLLRWHWKTVIVPLPILILLAVTFFLVALVIALIMKFIVPVMYRRRCGATEAFGEVWRLIVANPGSLHPLRALLHPALHRRRHNRLHRRLHHLLPRRPALPRHRHPSPPRHVSLHLPALFHPAVWRCLRRLGRRQPGGIARHRSQRAAATAHPADPAAATSPPAV